LLLWNLVTINDAHHSPDEEYHEQCNRFFTFGAIDSIEENKVKAE